MIFAALLFLSLTISLGDVEVVPALPHHLITRNGGGAGGGVEVGHLVGVPGRVLILLTAVEGAAVLVDEILLAGNHLPHFAAFRERIMTAAHHDCGAS